jgi:hypothetical protein
MREWLEAQEAQPHLPVLAWAAGLEIELDPDAAAAVRRALLLLAAGGDPNREIDLDGRAVTALAADLDEPGRHAQLAAGLSELRAQAAALPNVAGALELLLADAALAWRAYAAGVLVEALDG